MKDSGYTLLEMLVFIALFAVLVNICGGVFVTTGRLAAINTLQLERLNGVREVQQAFVESVQASLGAVPEAGGFISGDQTIVLRTGANSFRVFGDSGDGKRLRRLDFTTGGSAPAAEYLVTYPQEVKNVRIVQEGRVVTLEFEVLEQRGERVGPMRIHRISATPRMSTLEGGAR